MAYYVDNGSGRFTEFDSNDLQGAKEFAESSIESAKAFYIKMGFIPFWGKCTELRQGKKDLGAYQNNERANAEIAKSTKLIKLYVVQP